MWIALLLIAIGFVLLVFGGDLLVRGASGMAVAARVSPVVIGLTVVAMGTSAPEVAVSVQSTWIGKADLAIGNVVGSNIFNILFILGLSALIVPLIVSSQLVRRDVPLMIGASVLTYVLALDGSLGRLDGVFLFSLLLAYVIWTVRESRRQTEAELAVQFAEEIETRPRPVLQLIGLIVLGLVLLGLGANWLVEGAVIIARLAGMSELLIGLTIVAIGTSLPEVAASLAASLKGERDIAVGNVVGSNIFNLLGVLGVTAIIAPAGVAVSAQALQLDIPVMIVVAVAALPIFFTGHLIARWEGALFFFYYLVYTTYLIMLATGHAFTGRFGEIILLFILPLTVITLAIGVIRSLRASRA